MLYVVHASGPLTRIKERPKPLLPLSGEADLRGRLAMVPQFTPQEVEYILTGVLDSPILAREIARIIHAPVADLIHVAERLRDYTEQMEDQDEPEEPVQGREWTSDRMSNIRIFICAIGSCLSFGLLLAGILWLSEIAEKHFNGFFQLLSSLLCYIMISYSYKEAMRAFIASIKAPKIS